MTGRQIQKTQAFCHVVQGTRWTVAFMVFSTRRSLSCLVFGLLSGLVFGQGGITITGVRPIHVRPNPVKNPVENPVENPPLSSSDDTRIINGWIIGVRPIKPANALDSALSEPKPRKNSQVAKPVGQKPLATEPPSRPELRKDNWLITGATTRRLSLVEAILSSFQSKRVIHSLGADVAVDSVTLLDPEIIAQQITIAESRFDPTVASQVATNHIDSPPSSFFTAGIPINNKRDEIEFTSRLSKEWSSGATTSIGYEPSLAYLFLPRGNTGGFNPLISSDMVFRAVQPLLRGAGTPLNLATIRIAQNQYEQSQDEVVSKLQQQLRGIEQVYWQLQASHVRRDAIGEAIGLSQEIVKVERSRFEAGRVIYTDVARASYKTEDLYQQKLNSEQEIQRLSLQIAQLTGMDVVSNIMLVPSDPPEQRKPEFDLNDVTASALLRNPNLIRKRREIALRETQLEVASNQLKPQLDLRSSVRSGGLDDDLGSSLRDMARVEFVDVSVGLVYSRPVGNRTAKSRYRQVELDAARNRELLAAFERQIIFSITESINDLQFSYAGFESALRQLKEAQEWVKLSKIRYESPPQETGQEALLVSLLDYQSAIQSHVDALVRTALAIADYNARIASIEEQRGTLLERWRVTIADKNQE